jgi:hypothetical protein
MKKFLGPVAITALLSFVLSIAVMNWAVNDDFTKPFTNSKTLQVEAEGIRRVDIEVTNRRIYLEVHLTKPQSCKAIIKSLGIGTFILKGRIYEPTCVEVSKDLIKVVYSEASHT